MNRRLSLDKQGILSPTGSFLTPSPSPSIPASPRLQPSPSQSPFQSDVIVIGNNSNQDSVSAPIRRQSFNQISSPNTSAVVFRPSPTQSPAAATTVVGVVGNEFNTTLVGSNNISLNKKGKRSAVNQHGTGSVNTGNSKASSSTSTSAKKAAGSNTATNIITNTDLFAKNIRTPPPVQSVTYSNSTTPISYQPVLGGAVIQQPTNQVQIPNAASAVKQNKLPPQILPKPNISNSSSVITQPKNTTSMSTAQCEPNLTQQQQQPPQHQPTQPQLNTQPMQSNTQTPTPQQNAPLITTAAQHPASQASPIILPNLNQLLLNQMLQQNAPMILQQNTPQGVQLIIRPQTPQIAVIHNSRPQIQTPQQPQQLLRIVNANGQMQLATATPTFIVSSQSNLIQQNLQGIKAQTTNPLNPLQGLTSQAPQQIAAISGGQIIGRSMAQIQLNGNLAQIQMPNGLNGQFISQIPAQFQQNVTGFNQFNQLGNTNFQQLATTATGTYIQSPPPQQSSDMVVTGPNIQFTTQQTSQNVSVAQPLPSSQIIAVPPQQTQLIPTTIPTPEPIRNPTPILPTNAVVVPDSPKNQIFSQQPPSSELSTDVSPTTKKPAKKPKKPKAKKDSTSQQSTTPLIQTSLSSTAITSQTQSHAKIVQTSNPPIVSQTPVTTQSSQTSSQLPSFTTSTGKLDLANVMKLCGIMDDEDFMDTDETQPPPSTTPYDMPSSLNPTTTPSDIMVTIPCVQNSDMSHNRAFSFTIPSVDSGNTSMASFPDGSVKPITSKPNGDTTINAPNVCDAKMPTDRQYMIKIDNNDGTPPFPLSITLPHNLGPTTDSCETNKIVSMPVTSQNNQTLPLTNPISTPTLQSQINKIQNQLIGVQNHSASNSSTNNMSNTISTITATSTSSISTTTLTTSSAQKTPKKKQTNKRNNKKIMETINVPSQIGNIQISQVDRNKCTPNQSGKAIENQIQITPIVDSPNKSMTTTVTTPNQLPNNVIGITSSPAQQVTPSINNLNSNQAITMNLQPNQQILNIPNNVQIISSSSSNNLSTHGNIITNSISSNQGNNGGCVSSANGSVIISTSQSYPQIGLQRPTIQSSGVQTITNQGALITSNAQLSQSSSAPRQIQMTMQPTPNIQMQMLPTSTPMQAETPQMTTMPQLTGGLTLSFTEDGRLLLKHNANAPHDAQSQLILQAVLSGALCNVTLINEPTTTAATTTPQPNIQQTNLIDSNKPSIILKSNEAVPKPIISTSNTMSVNDRPQLITSQQPTQKPPNFSNVIQPIQNHQPQPPHPQQQQQQTPLPLQTPQMPTISQQQATQNITVNVPPNAMNNALGNNFHQSQPTTNPGVMPSTTIELPKIQPNQQLFSLNTVTNQITQLSPGLTTAALGPMERLLIVPAGVNKQQLAKCLMQGQIHFDNIGQATQANDTKPNIQQHQTMPQAIVQPNVQVQSQIQTTNLIQQQQQQQRTNLSNVKSTAPAMVAVQPNIINNKPETKPKKSRSKKAKAETNKGVKSDVVTKIDENSKKENDVSKNNIIISTNVPADGNVALKVPNEMQTKSINVSKVNPTQHPNNNNHIHPMVVQNNDASSHSLANAPRIMSQQPLPPSNMMSTQPIINQSPQTPTNHMNAAKIGANVTSQQKGLSITVNTSQSNVPPLISVNQPQMMVSPTNMPRVQTIQLTPQKQQSLKTVQMQIQTLSGRLQNKNLLSTIRPDLSPSNPLYNKPLPLLTNLNAMNDMEIFQALQRLFIEQQKILATGKVISSLPAGPNFSPNISTAPIITNQATVSPVKKIIVENKTSIVPTTISSPMPNNKMKPNYAARPMQSVQPVCIVSPQQQQNQQQQHQPSQPQQQQHQQQKSSIAKCEVTSSIATSSPIVSPVISTAKEATKQICQSPKPAEPIPKVQTSTSTALCPPPDIVLIQQPIQPTSVSRTSLFENQLKIDQDSCINPDYKSPFRSKEDAVKRLIRYHCMYSENEPDNENQSEDEERFVNAAYELKDKYNMMMNKYQMLLMKESMRTVRTSELMMLDRMIVTDIQEEISLIQSELKNLNEEIADTPIDNIVKEIQPPVESNEKLNLNAYAMQHDQIKSNCNIKTNIDDIECDEKPSIDVIKKNAEKITDTFISTNNMSQTIKNEMKGEQLDLIPTTVTEFNNQNIGRQTPSFKNIHNSNSINNLLSSNEMDVKPAFQSVSNKENSLSQLDMNFGYDPNLLGSSKRAQSSYDVKKELDNLDIESEITPCYISKKCDQSNRTEIVHSPLSTSDFDYLCSPSDSNTNHATNNRRKDELIACDKEPYDEWLCIQKELNLMSDKRSNDLNIDGFMESTLRNFSNDDENPCSSSKLNVDNQFSDLFSQRPNDAHNLDDEKSDMDSHLPLSELFNDSIVTNTVDNVDGGDKSVENRLENMFNDNPDFDKTNDLVESRLEELFHGSSPSHSAVNSSQVVNKMNQTFHHVENHSEFMMTPHQQTTSQNKRQWPNNGDVMPQMNLNEIHPVKRSCMMTSFMETTNSDDHQWIMDCQQSSSYDFHMDSDVNKRNGNNSWNGMMNGLTCDNGIENDNVGMMGNDLDQKKQSCFNAMSVKTNDLIERDLLGLSAHSSPSTLDNANSVLMQLQQNHMHNENVYQTGSDNNVTQSNAADNTNNIAPNFDDDMVNQHVQNAIDSILNLQNSENESLHFMDQSMGSFLSDGPLTPNLIHQQSSTANDFHFSPSQNTHQNSPFLS